MPLNDTSMAAVVGVGFKNVQFKASAQVLPRKILIIGTYDPTKTSVVPNVPVLALSAEQVGDECGFGYNIHRLAVHAFKGGKGTVTYYIPQEETGTQATGKITITASGVKAGTIYLYIGGVFVEKLSVAKDDTASEIAAKIVTAINAQKELRVTAVQGVGEDYEDEVDLTEKSKGECGNSTSIKFNLGFGQSNPTGVNFAVTVMSGGAGVPTIQDALDAIGTGDGSNEDWYTELIHGYGQDTTTLDAISDYVGEGNDYVGLYSKTIARPFRSIVGDVVAGSDGLSDLISLGGNRKTDRANGVIAAPGSPSHPDEIAAQTMGHLARINELGPERTAIGLQLEDIWPGEKTDRWTNDFDNRDTAVKAGISTTMVKSGVLTIQNAITFYHPDNVPQSSNVYRAMRNISIIQNILYNNNLTFSQEKWTGITIVADVTKVSSTIAKEKVRDIDMVRSELMTLADSFAGLAWLYTAGWTKDRLAESGYITIRNGATGFNIVFPVIFSGEGGIWDITVQGDISLAVLV